MKIEKKNQIINPFGGINFVIDTLKKEGILELIDNQLGKRAKQAQYSYSDVILNLWSVFFCGGDCAEDLQEHLKPILSTVPELKVASPDTVLRVLQSLKYPKETVVSSKNNKYETSRNDNLNQLNISILIKLGLLKSKKFYDLDYDNEILATQKRDAKKSYKHIIGYFPGMATIEGKPVYFENRDGNMNVKTDQASVLRRCFKMLDYNDIYIDRCRMDAGSYSEEIITEVEKNCNYFYIRANSCEYLTHQLLSKRDWKKAIINNVEYEVSSIDDYKPFGKQHSYRLVIMRRKKKNSHELDLFTQDNMEYRAIITNDETTREKEIIEFYNQRGGEERVIDIMNNDFGWKKMPFSFMEENTVFLIVMMICKNIFSWLITTFAKKFKGLKSNYRLKKFIFRFITVPVKWIKRGGQMILKIFSNKPYEYIRC
jgi:hypothetical protein